MGRRRFKFFHVNKSQTRECGKYKYVTREVQSWLLEVMSHQHGYLLFRQIFTWPDVLRNMELTKGIPFQEPTAQPKTLLPRAVHVIQRAGFHHGNDTLRQPAGRQSYQ